jgi:hypothetical protein
VVHAVRSVWPEAAPRAVREPTQIFVISPSPVAGRDPKTSRAVSQQQPSTAPLLCAFDDARRRATTWSTAKTISAPMSEVAEGQGSAKASVRASAVAEPKARSAGAKRLLGRLRLSAAAGKKIVALVAASATVVGLGTLVGGNIAKRVAPPTSSSKVEATASAPSTARAPAATIAAATPIAAPAEPLPAEPSPAEPLPAEPHERPATAPDGNASHDVTLARQAVDALLAGDRPRALEHYRELSRRAPDRDAYREAVRLLSASTSSPHLVGSP